MDGLNTLVEEIRNKLDLVYDILDEIAMDVDDLQKKEPLTPFQKMLKRHLLSGDWADFDDWLGLTCDGKHPFRDEYDVFVSYVSKDGRFDDLPETLRLHFDEHDRYFYDSNSAMEIDLKEYVSDPEKFEKTHGFMPMAIREFTNE